MALIRVRAVVALGALIVIMSTVAPVTASPYSDAVNALNPLGYWRFEGDTQDQTANNNDGTLVNGATFTAPGAGAPFVAEALTTQALTLPQAITRDYMNIPDGEPAAGQIFDIDSNQPLTLMAWVNTADTSGIILGKSTDATQFMGYHMSISGGKLVMIVQGGAGDTSYVGAQGTTDVVVGGWHFVAVTYDGSQSFSGMTLYVDGVAEVANNISGFPVGSSLTNVSLKVGSRFNGSAEVFELAGLVDEAAIFGTELSDTDVANVYAARLTPAPAEAGPVPEPATVMLLGLGTVAMLRRRCRVW